MKEKSKAIKIKCSDCGGGSRNHIIVKDYKVSGSDGQIDWGATYQICQCQGCDSVRFRQSEWFSEDYYYDDDGNIIMDEKVTIFPNEQLTNYSSAFTFSSELPEQILTIYEETIKAINMQMNILAGGGLRAIVEAICKDKKVQGRNLEDKIDELKAKDFLTKSQADLLHEERYIGNKALHEIEPTPIKDLQDGLEIIESMLKTIYVLPDKAERLKKKRLKTK